MKEVYKSPESRVSDQPSIDKQSLLKAFSVLILIVLTSWVLGNFVIPEMNSISANFLADRMAADYKDVRRISDLLFTALLKVPAIYCISLLLRRNRGLLLAIAGLITVSDSHYEVLWINSFDELLAPWYTILAFVEEIGIFVLVYYLLLKRNSGLA